MIPFNPLQPVLWLLVRIIKAGLNKRNIITLPLNFILNFALIIIWLTAFDKAKYIPNDIRPHINSKLAFLADTFLFGDTFKELNYQYNSSTLSTLSLATSLSFALVALIFIPLTLWFYLYHIRNIQHNIVERFDNILHFENSNNKRRLRLIIIPFFIPLISFIVLNCVHCLASQQDENFTKFKDLLAWTSYVVLHVMAPILTAVYLYVFHAPGVLKCFAIAMGIQNILGIVTHLLVPTASPWFVHLYGINDTEHVSYNQEGFAAGLTRVDTHMGTHLNTNGFHKSPIVFGAVPSLHSAIAFQCFLFIISRASSLKHRFATDPDFIPSSPSSSSTINVSESASSDSEDSEDIELADFNKSGTRRHLAQFTRLYDDDIARTERWYFKPFNKGLVPKLLVAAYIVLQWWATMYLDHHFRFDLFVGMLYSLATFMLVNCFYLQPVVLKNWLDIRMGKVDDTHNEARTMGMRVFQGTSIEWFFDPLA